MKKKLIYPCLALATLFTLIGCKGGGGGEDTFTVTFETYGGTPKPENQKVKKGGNAYRPSDPGTIVTEEGDEYSFDDWYVSPDSIDKFNFSNPITCDTTVYAHYNGGYTLDGKTNVDYNDFSDKNLLFKVKNRNGQEETGFKYNVYFPDFKTGVCIDENTGRLILGDENIYLYGYVYAYRENTKKQVGYDYAYKRIQIASFDCLDYKQIGNTGNYEVLLNTSYSYTDEPHFRLCVPEVYYDETNREIKGLITKISGEFGGFLAKTNGYPDIYIPDSIEEIGDNAFGFGDDKKCAHIMHISKGIKKIGNNAFKYCNGDGKPTFDFDFSDTKLESIGDFAFYKAHLDHKYIKLPETLNFIGEEAFYVGEYLRPSYIEFNNTKYWVKNDDSVMNILDVSDKNKNVNYFSPKDLINTPNYAKGIQKAVINQGALSYELASNGNTAKVKSVDEDKLVEFGGGSAKEKAVTIPDTVTFWGQTYTVNEISAGAFKDKTTINNVYLSDNIEKIGDEAFSGCSSLRSIHITKNVTSIGEKVFDNCYSLVSMSVDSENNTYGSSSIKDFYHAAILSKDGTILYYGCKSISDLNENRTFPQKVKVIKSHAFCGRYDSKDETSGLKGSIKFPASLVHIEQDAFKDAFNFAKYTSGYTIEFDSITKLWTISKDGSVAKSGVKVNIASHNLANFKAYSDHEWKYKEEGSNLSFVDSQYSKTSEVKGLGECTDGDIVIPNLHNNLKVTRMRKGAFKDKENIKTVSIGDNVAYFESSVFENCTGLTELILPKSVKEFGNPEFVSSTTKPHYVVQNSVFKGCTSLKKVYVEDYDSTWEYGTYDIKQTEIGYTAEFSKKGEFKFVDDPEENATFLTDYTTEGRLTVYAWRKANK